MARVATLIAIQCCPECHYCSTDITQIPEGGADVIQSPRYRETFESGSLPELCRKWGCWAQVLEASRCYAESGWAFLSAAWSCDDAHAVQAAVTYRDESIRLFEFAQHANQAFGKDSATERAILVDLYRRVGNCAHASQLAHSTVSMLEHETDSDKQLQQAILQFQLHLIAIGDTRSYSYAEAIRFAENPSTWRPRQWWEIFR